MDLGYKQEITVGALVILAIVGFLVGTTWLGGRPVGGADDDNWRVQFADVGNLKLSSVVRVSGVPVGKVESIELLEVGKVLVGISLDEKIVPRVDARAEIVPVGFVGDVAINFHPGEAPQTLPRERVITGTQAEGFTAQFEQLGDRADSVLLGAREIVNRRTAEELRATMTALQGTLRAARRTLEVYGDPREGPTAELTRTMASLRGLSARLDSTLAHPAVGRTLQRADTLTGNLAAMTAQLTATGARLDSLLLAMHRGQGTLGALARDSTLYWNVVRTTASLDSLLTELKRHPGKIGVTFKLF
ncbi:MAG TPA: MlaD family protein [Gemmatimonadales bacterium]|nr:MlaD family protein [Gemmatimonadales bacterium]